ncbi:hypothetical protein LAZ67_2002198 [Cordylochernes scorpioides]|uniref:Uncharacterized protein n=1 Tax=Cordylochernes scorpioides TaxID=51811 RepID=A0ABY6K325_9ARAC|nr:hypothetical protein LAZ67_2002198 [Cordylochernes scorpioides]
MLRILLCVACLGYAVMAKEEYSNGGSSSSVSFPGSAGSDSSAAVNSGGRATQNGQGNLYYYYYPVAERPKDNAGGYAAAASSQTYATSAVAPESYDHQPAGSEYSAEESGYSAPHMDSAAAAAAAAASYGAAGGYPPHALSAGYAAPSAPAGYGAAAAGYGAYPNAAYGSNLAGYGGQYGYGISQGEYGQQKKLGLSSLIMPMLALAGLGLLIPTVTNLSSRTKKTKRSVNDSRLERYLALYRSAVENEDCMSRIVCEMGDAVSDVKGKTAILTIMEKFTPAWMRQKMSIFKSAALTSEMGKCKKYKC